MLNPTPGARTQEPGYAFRQSMLQRQAAFLPGREWVCQQSGDLSFERRITFPKDNAQGAALCCVHVRPPYEPGTCLGGTTVFAKHATEACVHLSLPLQTLAPFFKGLMAHVCCAMTHLAAPIRASALPTLDLLLQTYPHLTLAYQHQARAPQHIPPLHLVFLTCVLSWCSCRRVLQSGWHPFRHLSVARCAHGKETVALCPLPLALSRLQILSHFADLLSQRGPAARSAPAVAPVLESLLHLGLASLSCTSAGTTSGTSAGTTSGTSSGAVSETASTAAALRAQPYARGAPEGTPPSTSGAAQRGGSGVSASTAGTQGSGGSGGAESQGRVWDWGQDPLLSLAQSDAIDAMILHSARSSMGSSTHGGQGRDSRLGRAQEVDLHSSWGAAPVVAHSWAPGAFFAQEELPHQEHSGEASGAARQIVWGSERRLSPPAIQLTPTEPQARHAAGNLEGGRVHEEGGEGEGARGSECWIGFLPQRLFGLVLSDLHERAGMAVGISSSQGGSAGGGGSGSSGVGRGAGASDNAAVACVTTALKILMLCCAQSQTAAVQAQESLSSSQSPSHPLTLLPHASSGASLSHPTSVQDPRKAYSDRNSGNGNADTMPSKERQALLRTLLSRCAFPLSAPPGASSPSALQPLAEINVLCAQLLTLLLRAPPSSAAPRGVPPSHRHASAAVPAPAYPVRYAVHQAVETLDSQLPLVYQSLQQGAPAPWHQPQYPQELLHHVHMSQRGGQRSGQGQGQEDVYSARACSTLLRYLGEALGGQVLPGQGSTVSGALSGGFLSEAVRRLLFCVPRAAALAASLAPALGPHPPPYPVPDTEEAGSLGAARLAPQDLELEREAAGASSSGNRGPQSQLQPLLAALSRLLWSAQPLGGPTTAACLAAMQALLLHPGQKGPPGGGAQGASDWEACLVPEEVWCQWVKDLPKLLWELKAQRPQLSHVSPSPLCVRRLLVPAKEGQPCVGRAVLCCVQLQQPSKPHCVFMLLIKLMQSSLFCSLSYAGLSPLCSFLFLAGDSETPTLSCVLPSALLCSHPWYAVDDGGVWCTTAQWGDWRSIAGRGSIGRSPLPPHAIVCRHPPLASPQAAQSAQECKEDTDPRACRGRRMGGRNAAGPSPAPSDAPLWPFPLPPRPHKVPGPVPPLAPPLRPAAAPQVPGPVLPRGSPGAPGPCRAGRGDGAGAVRAAHCAP